MLVSDPSTQVASQQPFISQSQLQDLSCHSSQPSVGVYQESTSSLYGAVARAIQTQRSVDRSQTGSPSSRPSFVSLACERSPVVPHAHEFIGDNNGTYWVLENLILKIIQLFIFNRKAGCYRLIKNY